MHGMASALSPPPTGWSKSVDYCAWPGIACDVDNRVSTIYLPSQSLTGTLPTSLNSLSQLQSLSLRNNRLSGPLPSFANLSLLVSLHLDCNNFSSIPPAAFAGLTNLQTLSLSNNPNLAPWSFPSELASSPHLVAFHASGVNMMGSIPDIFGSFTTLRDVRLSWNNLTASLPPSFNGSAIQTLWLNSQAQHLSGSIDVISGMTHLTQLWLHSNHFSGPIPDFSACQQIFDLQLGFNLFTGILPLSLLSLPKLANLSLAENLIQGPLPLFPGNMIVNVGDSPEANRFCMSTDAGDACDPQVTTLLVIAKELGYPSTLAKAWMGNNACNGWKFVNCDSQGHVIFVNFQKQGFSGTISPAFINLTHLTKLYLNDNNLTGTIPNCLTTLIQLSLIDVSNNDLSGKVPDFRSGVSFVTSGNPKIGHDVPAPGGAPRSPSSSSVGSGGGSKGYSVLGGVVAGSLIAVLVFVVIVIFVSYKYYVKRRFTKSGQLKSKECDHQRDNSSLMTLDSPVNFSYNSLLAATNNFDIQKKLGGGGFGSVFEGSLSDGTKVAVKRLDNLGQGRKEFTAEVQTIGSIHHVNLVKLVGFCVENTHKLLVYEHMSHGSLDKWIFNTNSRASLAWDTKKNIILQIAKGLMYLHEECHKRIVHLDVKPQNVLLDNEFNAKLSDFGLAKLMDREQSFVMTQMRGTRGYLAPEWLCRKITEKTDVYSYGVVVLEVVFGRRNLDYSEPEESVLLINMVKKAAEESRLSDLLNQCIDDTGKNEDMAKIVMLAIWCLHTEPVRRPSMSTVVKVLEGIVIQQAINDYTIFPMVEINESLDTTQISASILSGPR